MPIIHEGGTHKQPISEIKIDWSKPWLLQHKRAIISAYRTSAYFEYYQDELFAILDSQPERLFDLNMAIIRFFIEKTGIAVNLHTTEAYSREGIVCTNGQEESCTDLREAIHPKRPNSILKDMELEKIGPAFEHHKCFPNRTNTEFVEIIDRENVFMRVWERGSGETLACGTP